MKAFVIDLSRCNGCRNCQVSCKDEHVGNDWEPYAKPQPDTGQFWCKVEEKTEGQVPHVQVNYLSRMCNHCRNPKCAEVCPQNAFEIREDGLVVLLPDKCTGCGACQAACPYGVIYKNEALGICQKCTGCAHLLDDGWEVPRCVDSCCTGALRFGDEEDLASEIAHSEVLMEETGCGPRVYYLNNPKKFVAGTIVDFDADEVLIDTPIELLSSDGVVIATTQTDFLGNFWFRRIEPSMYSVRVQPEGYFARMIKANATKESISLGAIGVSKLQ